MKTIDTTITVRDDHTGVMQLPPEIPAGQHRATILLDEDNGRPRLRVLIPIDEIGPWPEGDPLRREDLYDDAN